MPKKTLSTSPHGHVIYGSDSSHSVDSGSDSTESTEPYGVQPEEDIVCEKDEDETSCKNCGYPIISFEEAQRITHAEASTFVQLHAPKIIELETIKFNAKERKLNGPGVLRRMKSCVTSKKTQ